jgi:hypothetical protein
MKDDDIYQDKKDKILQKLAFRITEVSSKIIPNK